MTDSVRLLSRDDVLAFNSRWTDQDREIVSREVDRLEGLLHRFLVPPSGGSIRMVDSSGDTIGYVGKGFFGWKQSVFDGLAQKPWGTVRDDRDDSTRLELSTWKGHGDRTKESARLTRPEASDGGSTSAARPASDDQLAESDEVNPALVEEYQSALENGYYAVEDLPGIAKSRGSGQAVFAKAVKDSYGWTCAVTGIRTRSFLVASHIVPWSEDKSIRTDPTNGICLSTFVDRAFDTGYLVITPEGWTNVRWDRVEDDPELTAELSKIDQVVLAIPRRFPPDPEKLARRLELGY